MFKDICYDVIRSTFKVNIKSMAHEFKAAFCDADLDPCEADEITLDRLNTWKQHLQHQINDEHQFDGICPCLRHNVSLTCKVRLWQWPHVHRCDASDQIMSDKHYPNYQVDDEKFFRKIKVMNVYIMPQDRRATKLRKIETI